MSNRGFPVLTGWVRWSFMAQAMRCAFGSILLKRQPHQPKWAKRFNRGMDKLTMRYQKLSARSMQFKMTMLAVFSICVLGFGWLYKTLPEGLMPTEDMGFVMGQIVMPGNAPR